MRRLVPLLSYFLIVGCGSSPILSFSASLDVSNGAFSFDDVPNENSSFTRTINYDKISGILYKFRTVVASKEVVEESSDALTQELKEKLAMTLEDIHIRGLRSDYPSDGSQSDATTQVKILFVTENASKAVSIDTAARNLPKSLNSLLFFILNGVLL